MWLLISAADQAAVKMCVCIVSLFIDFLDVTCCVFDLRRRPTRELAVQAEWLLVNVSGFTQPGPLNMRWRKQLCLRFKGPTWGM